MTASDAVLWDIEQDPELRSTITAVALLDRAPKWDRLVTRIDYASRVIPRLRQRVVASPLRLGARRWVVDSEFDLAYHLRRARVPEPGTFRDLLDLVQPLAEEAFDPARPLWEFTLVEGLEGGQAAFVQKIHHTMTDGVGAIELALAILDGRRNARERELPSVPDPSRTGGLADVAGAVAVAAGSVFRVGWDVPMAGVRAAIGVTRDPVGSVRSASRMAVSVGRMVAPVPKSASPILIGRSLGRRFDTIEVSLAELKLAARRVGCSVNDAFLAAVVEGLRRYHTRHDVEVDQLRLTMPINLRADGQELGGNHFAPVRFAVPTGISEPAVRMQSIGEIARRWRSEPALVHSGAIAAVLDRLPTPITSAVFGAMLKHVDAVVTNVPGIPSRSYLAGAELIREYAFAPPAGAAVNVALLSHLDTACIGVVSDPTAVPDPDVLLSCLVEGFDDVLSVISGHAHRTSE